MEPVQYTLTRKLGTVRERERERERERRAINNYHFGQVANQTLFEITTGIIGKTASKYAKSC